jgi:hypothetical protein
VLEEGTLKKGTLEEEPAVGAVTEEVVKEGASRRRSVRKRALVRPADMSSYTTPEDQALVNRAWTQLTKVSA